MSYLEESEPTDCNQFMCPITREYIGKASSEIAKHRYKLMELRSLNLVPVLIDNLIISYEDDSHVVVCALYQTMMHKVILRNRLQYLFAWATHFTIKEQMDFIRLENMLERQHDEMNNFIISLQDPFEYTSDDYTARPRQRARLYLPPSLTQ